MQMCWAKFLPVMHANDKTWHDDGIHLCRRENPPSPLETEDPLSHFTSACPDKQQQQGVKDTPLITDGRGRLKLHGVLMQFVIHCSCYVRQLSVMII